MNNQSGKTALVLIDMQHALYNAPAKPHDGDAVLDRVLSLIDRARAAKTPVVFVQHCSPEGTACAKGSQGWRLLEPLRPTAEDIRIEKTRPSIFFATGLHARLEKAGIGRLVLAGMKTEYCIDTSCRVAAELGYGVVLAADAHTTVDGPALSARSIIDHHNLVLGGPFADVRPADQIDFA